MARAGEFIDLLGELASGGILIVDGFADAPVDSSNEPIAFRTLVQLDGDLCVSIHADALARSDFAAAFARHSEHVRAVLSDKQARLRGFTDVMIRRGRVFGFVVGFGSGSWVGEVKLLVLSVSMEFTAVAAAATGAVLFGAIGRASVRAVLRRQGFNRPRLHAKADDDGL